MTETNAVRSAVFQGWRGVAWLLLDVVVFAGCSTPTLSRWSAPSVLVPVRAAQVAPEAETGGPGELGVWAPTLDEAIQRAIACNGQINALRAAMSVAEQRRLAATDIVDPELKLGAGRSGADSLRSRWGSRDSVSGSTEEQTSHGTRIEGQNTVGSDGLPQSSSESVQNDSSYSLSTSQGTETQSSRTSGYAMDSGSDWRIDARFFIPNPWLVGPRVQARKAEIEAVHADWRAATWRVACDVRKRYVEVSHLVGEVATEEELVRLDGVILKTMQERGEQGTATVADVLSASRRHLQVQDGLDQARYRFKVAQRGLAAVLNVAPGALQIGANQVPVRALPEAVMPFARATDLAMQCRSDLAALQWRMVAAKASYREARNVRLPWIKELSVGYGRSREHSWGEDVTTGSGYAAGTTTQSSTGSGQSRETKTGFDGTGEYTTGAFEEWQQSESSRTSSSSEYGISGASDRRSGDEWWVGVAIDVPIFSLTRNHESDVLLAECKLADVNMAEGVRQIRAELRDALDELEDSRRQQTRYADEVAPVIAEMRKALATLKDVPNGMPDTAAATEMQIVESDRLARNARHRYQLALISLEQAIGAPMSVRSQP